MYLAVLLLAAPAANVSTPRPLPPVCRAAQLRLSVDGRDGDFDGMSHSGAELSISNRGADCSLPRLPTIELRDARGHVLPAFRQVPVGMHPGPVMIPVRIGAGHRVMIDLRWTSGPVFPASRSVTAVTVGVRIGHALVRSPIKAVLFGQAGKTVTFEQTPVQVAEGMAAD